MKPTRYMVIRAKEMEVVCFSNDIGAVLDYVATQSKNEDAELIIYELLQKAAE